MNTIYDQVELEVNTTIHSRPVGSYDHLPTKSAKIRAMRSDGFKTTQISKILGIRYQHVRNVLNTPLKSH